MKHTLRLYGCLLFIVVVAAGSYSWTFASDVKVKWRLADSTGITGDSLVYGYSVSDFNVHGDGKTDDTKAFQNALDTMEKAGGGTVFVPAGRYALRGNLRIPTSVTLRGEWKKPVSGAPFSGTILQVYAGRGDGSGPPFIILNFCAGIRDLTLWYPEQKVDSITPYPFAVRQLGGDNATVENVTFVNAYQGIDIGPNFNELHYIHNVYGTVLSLGIRFDVTTDIGRLENIHFSPGYWEKSDFPNSPGKTGSLLRSWLLEHGTGIHMLRSDWEYGSSVTVEGYHTGFMISGSSRGYPNAQFYGFSIINCRLPLYIKGSNSIGLAFTRCRFEGLERAVEAAPSFKTLVQFYDCRFKGRKGILNRGTGHMSFQHCSFLEGPLQADNGTLALVDCDAAPAALPFTLGPNVIAATFLSNRFAGKPSIINHGSGNDVKINQKQFSFPVLPPFHDIDFKPVKPGKKKLYVVTDPVWGARGDGNNDDTAAIQKALNAAGADQGGIVFLPPGNYRLTGSIIVPAGVELRGIHEVPHHTMGKGSVLYIEGGKGSAKGKGAVVLKEKSILRGLVCHYPGQSFSSPVPYPFTIQGQGEDISIIDIAASNPYQFVDLFSHRCDRHFVDYVSGAPLKTGIRVGGGSCDGTIRNTQFNPHYWFRSRQPGSPGGGDWNVFWTYQKEHLDAFVFGDCRREVQFQNFVFGSLYGIHLLRENGRGPTGIILGHGTDGSKVSARIDGLGAEGMDFINAELVCMASTRKRYIHLGKELTSKVAFFNTLLWGDPDYTAIIEAGTLTMQQANYLRYGKGFILQGGRLNLTNSFFWKDGSILDLEKTSARVVSMANVFKAGLRTSDGRTLFPDSIEELSGKNPVVSICDVQREKMLPPGIKKISVVLTKPQKKKGLSFVTRNGESRNVAVVKKGIPGWRSVNALYGDKVRYMYFDVNYREFKNGGAPHVLLTIQYFDEGRFPVRVVYDSSDVSVKVTSAQGAWKHAGRFKTQDTGTWKTANFTLTDALFRSRCNGSDIRLEIPGGEGLVVGGVILEKQ